MNSQFNNYTIGLLFITVILLTILFNLVAIPNDINIIQEDVNFETVSLKPQIDIDVEVKSYVFRNELNTDHESTLYTGELVITNYNDIPTNEHKYLILDVNLEIPNSVSSYEIANLKVTNGTNIYDPLDSAFLKNHYYNPITATELSSGFISGHLVYQVPNSLSENDLIFTAGDTNINLWELENIVEQTSIVKDTNVTFLNEDNIDYQSQQDEVDQRIQKALDSGDYTLQNPYIVQDPYGRSPLTALVCFVTDEEVQINVNVKPKGEYGNVEYTIPTTTKSHLVPITGLYANYNNIITLTSSNGETKIIEIQTGELPAGSPNIELELLELDVENEHFTQLAYLGSFPSIIDVTGEVRWIYSMTTNLSYAYMENGHMLLQTNVQYGTGNENINMTAIIYEVDMLGKIYNIYEIEDRMHHDFMYLGNNLVAWTSNQDTRVGMEDAITILNLKDGTIAENINLNFILDRYRPSLSYPYFEDWFHANSIDYNHEDDSMIISGRQQGIIKIDNNRELEWILAPHIDWTDEYKPYLLTPVDREGNQLFDMTNEEDFWEANFNFFPWHNHGIGFCEDLDGNPNTLEISIFDNRALNGEYADENPYSQGTVYSINAKEKTVYIYQQYGKEFGREFNSTTISDNNVLDNNNLLITSGDLTIHSNIKSHMVEVSPENELLWSVKFDENIWEADVVSMYPENYIHTLNNSINQQQYTPLKVLDEVPYIDEYDINICDISSIDVSYYNDTSILLNGEFNDFEFDRQYGYFTAFKEDDTKEVYGFLVQIADNNINSNDLIHLKGEGYTSYQISVVDERAGVIYQYPIKEWIPNKINLLIWQENDNTLINKGNIENAKIDLINENFTIKGWSILPNYDTNVSTILNLVCKGEKESYYFPIDIKLRGDVTSHFNDGFNYNYSGFNKTIRLSNLPFDKYQIGIEIINKDVVGYYDTQYYIELGNNLTEEIQSQDMVLQQNIITEQIFAEYESADYSLESPYIKVNPYGIAPLSAMVLFETERSAQISIEVDGLNGGDTISHSYTDYNTSHQIPILGLYPQIETTVTLTATYQDGSIQTNSFMLAGDALPDDFVAMTVDTSTPSEMAYGLTFYMRQSRETYLNALDSKGDVRFIFSQNSIGMASGLTMLSNGNLAVVSEKTTGTQYYKDSFYEMDLTGKIYGEYLLDGVHHEISEANNGNFLALGNDINGSVIEDTLYEIDRKTGEIIQYWDIDDYLPIDSFDDDGNRISTEVYSSSSHDWIHLNSIDQHPITNELLLSGRNHDVVFSIDYDTGDINYILGDNSVPLIAELKSKLLTPIGDEFEWFYGQHNAQFLENGDILLFDNGSFRSKTVDEQIDSATQGYSRGVIYRVNQDDMTIEQIWQYGKELGSSHLATYLSGIQYLGDEHLLINFGGQVFDENGNASYQNADGVKGHSASIQYEIKNGEIIYASSFEISGVSGNMYRAERHNPYQSETQPNFSINSVRLGTLPNRSLAQESTVPTQDNLELNNSSVIDNGVQLVYTFSITDADSEDEAYLIFNSSETCYEILIGKGATVTGTLNLVELPTGTFDLYLKSGENTTNLNLTR